MALTREKRQQPPGARPNADLQIELTTLIYHKLRPTMLASSMGMIGASALLAHLYQDTRLWILVGVMTFASLMRVAIVTAFQSPQVQQQLTEASALRWEHRYALQTIFYCCLLGLSTIYNTTVHDSTAWALCIFGIFTICAGLSGRMGVRPVYLHTCSAVLLLSLTYGIYRMQPIYPVAFVGITLLFGFANYSSVENKYALLLDQLRARQKLRELTERDGLTALANRRYFEERLATACRQGSPFALLYIDLDRFKLVNDTHGHGVGDTLLKLVADRLCAAVREHDLVARLGGDEFAILQTQVCSSIAAEDLALRINKAVSALFLIGELAISIGASIGIRISVPAHDNPEELLKSADAALYRVKQTGRGGFAVAEM